MAALSHTDDEEGSKEFGSSLLSSLALFCLNRWPAGTGCSSPFYGADGRKMAFSNNNCGYFPVPIVFWCPILHFQETMKNSMRGLAERWCRIQWTCIKIHLKNLHIGLNICPAHRTIIANECGVNKHVLNLWRRSWKFPSFRVIFKSEIDLKLSSAANKHSTWKHLRQNINTCGSGRGA